MPDSPGVLNYPTALDTAVSLIESANSATTALTAGYTAGDATLTVASNALFPTSGLLTFPTNGLILKYTGKSSTTGFTGVSWAGSTLEKNNPADTNVASGAVVEQRITSGTLAVLRSALIALETKVGIGASALATTYAPRLSNQPNWPGTINPNYQLGTYRRGIGPFTADGAVTSECYRMDLGVGSALQVDRALYPDTWDPSSDRGLKLTHDYGGGGSAGYSRILTESGEYFQWRAYPVSYSAWVKCSVANAVRIALFDATTLGTTKAAGTGGVGLQNLVGCGQTGTNRQFSAYHSGGGGWEYLTCENFTMGASNTRFVMECWLEKSGTFYLDENPCIAGPTAFPIDQFGNADPYFEVLRYEGHYQIVGLQAQWIASGPLDVRTFPIPFRSAFQGQVQGTKTPTQGSHASSNCTVAVSTIGAATTEGLNGWFTVTPIAAGLVVCDELWGFQSDVAP